MNYRNTITGQIISEDCYLLIPNSEKHHYEKVFDDVTHEVDTDESGSIILTALAVESLVNGDTDLGRVDSGSSDFGGFGDGDTGGAGASDDF